jgi:peroxiredoxin
VANELDRRGIGLIAVSYDPPAVLREFAEAKGITFPLLADEGSRVITELGLLDRDLADHHAKFGVPTQEHQHGVAYPAIFVLDESGRVVDKRIRENYRARDGALKLLEEALGVTLPAGGNQVTSAGRQVSVAAVTDSDLYVRWQETRLRVVFDVEPGWHIYGRPIPNGYTPVTIEVASSPEVTFGPAEYPSTHPFKVDGLDEHFEVNEGNFDILVPFAVNVPTRHGAIDLEVSVRYQVCSQSECVPPERLKLNLRLEEAPPA